MMGGGGDYSVLEKVPSDDEGLEIGEKVDLDVDSTEHNALELHHRIIQSFVTKVWYTNEDCIDYATRIGVRPLSLYNEHAKWWHKGSVYYGSLKRGGDSSCHRCLEPRGSIPNEPCAICLEDLNCNVVALNGCRHCFHECCIVECIVKLNRARVTCPICKGLSLAGKGPSPPGKMSWAIKRDKIILNEDDNFIMPIEICYRIKGGVQMKMHTNPGNMYKSLVKRAYLPTSPDFILVLRLLIFAFLDGETFKIADDFDGSPGVVVWNGIEHKTCIFGGVENSGFPDAGYKQRVLLDIQAKNVKMS